VVLALIQPAVSGDHRIGDEAVRRNNNIIVKNSFSAFAVFEISCASS
jgi:hypothetical protein